MRWPKAVQNIDDIDKYFFNKDVRVSVFGAAKVGSLPSILLFPPTYQAHYGNPSHPYRADCPEFGGTTPPTSRSVIVLVANNGNSVAVAVESSVLSAIWC